MEIKNLKGVGTQLERKLNNLNIYTIQDLLENYPYRYNYINIVNINDVKENENCMIKATIVDAGRVQYIKRNFNRLSFRAVSDNVILNVTIFNRAFLKQSLTIGKEIILIGKYNKMKSSFVASDIKFNLKNNSIEPVYHLVEGIKNNQVIKLMDEVLKYDYIYDIVPEELTSKYNFVSKKEAIKFIHKPETMEDAKKAIVRLKYEELFNFMFKINYLKKINNKAIGIKRKVNENSKGDFMNGLPFTLTKDQVTTIDDIYKDLTDEFRMNRLVLGDVGSGKTIVATYAIYLNYLSGYQSALMAPTEILAEQHYKSISKTLEKFNIKVSFLTGSMKKKDKNIVLEGLKNGEINLIIGTHALIGDGVEFKNLGLVVTDEQHRFGVGQRNTLRDKGITPDVLYLSATPIPRTYALTIYGDLDISIIKTKPQGRKEIITKVESENNIKDVLYKMLEELKNNHQIYVVSPLIENNEELDLKSVFDLKEKLDIAFQNKVSVGVLHGKLKQNEKDKIMEAFKNGDIKILISTTVIEVGIDVPNSTMMVIYNAERFGLATLHQLRGRVGRNELQSYCYLISNKEVDRLKVLEESNDGFYISEKDFQMRGQGDLFGVKQSGDMPFKIANLKDDYQILLQAKLDSSEYIEKELYLNNSYYKNLIDNISFIN
ncbi:MAG: ATP-dependent DNA helicase RecG [Firmicutes bacterium]|nr:ATP-dependent DNA helicase RecG [Bacillota bacterium]